MNREAIYAALAERIRVNVDSVKDVSRRPKSPDQVGPEEQPVIYLEQGTSTATGQVGMPSRHLIHCTVGIYVYEESATGPMPKLNDLVEQVEDALMAQADEKYRSPGATTLGGLAASVRPLEVKFSNDKAGAQGVAVLDIEILAAG